MRGCARLAGGKYDLLRQCAGNARLLETWDFLLELLNADADRDRLRQVLSSVGELTARRSGAVASAPAPV